MNAISATRRTIRREWTAFGTLLIISVGMMGVSGTKPAHDLEAAVNWAAVPVESAIQRCRYGRVVHIRADSDRPARQQEQAAHGRDVTLQEELDRMPSISKLSDDWTKITAAPLGSVSDKAVRVIVREHLVGARTLVVNKGGNDGLVEGQVVIDAGGALVGRIQTVDPRPPRSCSSATSPPSWSQGVKSAPSERSRLISGQLQMTGVDVART